MFRVLSSPTYSKGNSDISVTELIAPPRIRQLMLRFSDEIEVDAADSIYALFGTLTHELLQRIKLGLAGTNAERRLQAISDVLAKMEERVEEEGEASLLELPSELEKAIVKADEEQVLVEHDRLFETRLFTEYNGWVISGQIDDLRIAEGRINDYKVCSRYVERDQGNKPDWEKQLNLYRWLAQRNGYKINRLTIEAFYRDWSKRQAARDPQYPQKQSNTFEIPIWSDDKLETYVAERVEHHQLAEKLPTDMLPMCTAEERWATETKYAVTKAGRTRAIRILDTQHEAAEWIANNKKPGEQLIMERRDGTSTRCESYCNAWSVCPFGRMTRANLKAAG